MTGHSLRVRVRGHLLHRLVIDPDDNVAARAEAVFYHGQGDCAERYLDVLHPFARRGVRCTITELPGHGHSPGRRGHAGNAALLNDIINSTLQDIAGRGNLPYGVLGHSMGGLLAARHLVLAGRGELPMPGFAWLSSPLVRPGSGRKACFRALVRLLAPWVPSVTFCTRVKSEDCRIKPDTGQAADQGGTAVDPEIVKHPLWHDRISLGWGATLLDFAGLVDQGVQDIPPDIPLLCTQGDEDPVCPAALTQGLFERLPNREKRYVLLRGLRHEPFQGAGSEQLYAALDDWLETLPV